MGKSAKTHCPECGTEPEVNLEVMGGLSDSVVKATAEEIVMEIQCRADNCNRVWRAVYCFAGNQ